MAVSNEPYQDTNTALFSSLTLSRHMYARAHGVKLGDYAGRVYAQCLGKKLGHLSPTATKKILL